MKTIITTLILLCCSIFGFAQGNYEKGMGEALGLWKKGENAKAIALFERISLAEKDKWLPAYYQAMVLTTSAFQEKDAAQKNKYIETASNILNQKAQDNNDEWLVLRALNLIADLTSDPMSKAPQLSPLIIELYEKALAINPKNPRAIVGLAEFQMNSKKYFHQDTKKECEDIQKALSLFDQGKTEVLFAPNWGKERAEEIIKNCK